MASAGDLPDDIDALKAALLAANDRAAQVEAELAVAKAKASNDQALIAHQQLQIGVRPVKAWLIKGRLYRYRVSLQLFVTLNTAGVRSGPRSNVRLAEEQRRMTGCGRPDSA